MRRGAGVRSREPAKARNVAGEFEDSGVINVVQHAADRGHALIAERLPWII
jgi:hypothetical protein